MLHDVFVNFICFVQITKPGLEENLEFNLIGLIKVQLVGNIMRKWINMSLRKVRKIQFCSDSALALFVNLLCHLLWLLSRLQDRLWRKLWSSDRQGG